MPHCLGGTWHGGLMRLWRKRDSGNRPEPTSPNPGTTIPSAPPEERHGLRRPPVAQQRDATPGAVERLRSGPPPVDDIDLADDIPSVEEPDIPDVPEVPEPLSFAEPPEPTTPD